MCKRWSQIPCQTHAINSFHLISDQYRTCMILTYKKRKELVNMKVILCLAFDNNYTWWFFYFLLLNHFLKKKTHWLRNMFLCNISLMSCVDPELFLGGDVRDNFVGQERGQRVCLRLYYVNILSLNFRE